MLETSKHRTNSSGFVTFTALLAVLAAGCVHREDFHAPVRPLPRAADSTGPVSIQGPLTEATVLRALVRNNPSLAALEGKVRAADAAVDQVRASFYPVLDANVNYLRADAPSAYFFKRIDARKLQFQGTDFNDPGAFSDVEAGLNLRWNLYAGGRDQLRSWAAEVGAESVRAQLTALKNHLASQALLSMVHVRLARALAAAHEQSVRSVEAQIAEARIRVEGGTLLRSDLLSLQVRLAEAKERRIRSQLAERRAETALRELLDLPADTALDIPDESHLVPDLPADAEAALEKAWTTREDLRAARLLVKARRMEVEAAARAWLPTIDLQARLYGNTAETSLDFGDADWTVGLGLGYRVADGGARSAALQRARGALDAALAESRRLEASAARQVRDAWLAITEAEQRLEVARTALAAAEESFRLVTAQYEGGAATITRYLEAESQRTGAKAREIAARLDLEAARIGAAGALGFWNSLETPSKESESK